MILLLLCYSYNNFKIQLNDNKIPIETADKSIIKIIFNIDRSVDNLFDLKNKFHDNELTLAHVRENVIIESNKLENKLYKIINIIDNNIQGTSVLSDNIEILLQADNFIIK